jgi:hypothetical protein
MQQPHTHARNEIEWNLESCFFRAPLHHDATHRRCLLICCRRILLTTSKLGRDILLNCIMGGGHHHHNPEADPKRDQDIQALKDAKVL